MPRSPQVFLADILSATEYILERTAGSTLSEYRKDRDLRSIVERQFITIGEAMTSLRREFPLVADELDQQNPVIAFCNFIVHRYWAIDDDQVWSVVVTKVAPLQTAVANLLHDIRLDP